MARNMFWVDRRWIVMGERHVGRCTRGNKSVAPKGCDRPTHHENEDNKEDKSCEVNGSKHRVGLLDFRKLKVSQDDTELCESAQTENKINDRKEAAEHL